MAWTVKYSQPLGACFLASRVLTNSRRTLVASLHFSSPDYTLSDPHAGNTTRMDIRSVTKKISDRWFGRPSTATRFPSNGCGQPLQLLTSLFNPRIDGGMGIVRAYVSRSMMTP